MAFYREIGEEETVFVLSNGGTGIFFPRNSLKWSHGKDEGFSRLLEVKIWSYDGGWYWMYNEVRKNSRFWIEEDWTIHFCCFIFFFFLTFAN